MQYINMMTIADNLEDLMFAKIDIERKLINEGVIQKKHSLEDFIGKDLGIAKYIYAEGTSTIPFNVVQGDQNNYMVYTADKNDGGALENLKATLKRINYDFDKLHKKSNLEMIENGVMTNIPYFLYKNEFYTE